MSTCCILLLPAEKKVFFSLYGSCCLSIWIPNCEYLLVRYIQKSARCWSEISSEGFISGKGWSSSTPLALGSFSVWSFGIGSVVHWLQETPGVNTQCLSLYSACIQIIKNKQTNKKYLQSSLNHNLVYREAVWLPWYSCGFSRIPNNLFEFWCTLTRQVLQCNDLLILKENTLLLYLEPLSTKCVFYF